MSGDRRPEEVAVVVRRPGRDGVEYLVLLRSPEKLGYWHLVAGGVEWGEAPDTPRRPASSREETGLSRRAETARHGPLDYDLSGDPESVRERFPAGTERIVVWAYVADAPAGLGADARRGARRRTAGSPSTVPSPCSTIPSPARPCGDAAAAR